jgi:hypothetical protein
VSETGGERPRRRWSWRLALLPVAAAGAITAGVVTGSGADGTYCRYSASDLTYK